MTEFQEQLTEDVAAIFRGKWEESDGYTVPEPEDIPLGNNAKRIDGTVLYADIAESTALVDRERPSVAAELYKTYLHCASKIVRHFDGDITAFDGDRIMAVFVGNGKNTNAARAALAINWAVINVIPPRFKTIYSRDSQLRHGVGIDTGPLFVAKTGIRGSNDLVWVGKAANHAAKLCAIRTNDHPLWITGPVFDVLNDSAKTYGGTAMWEERNWTTYGRRVYRSSWWLMP